MTYRTRNAAADVPLTAPRAHARGKGRAVRWTTRMKAEFLDALATSCNVVTAAEAIGVDPSSVYGLRRRDPEFLREWGLAVEAGYQLVETRLLSHVLAGGGRIGAIEPAGIEPGGIAQPLDYECALRLLAQHQPGRQGQRKRPGPRFREATEAETNAAILKKLAAIEKRRAAS